VSASGRLRVWLGAFVPAAAGTYRLWAVSHGWCGEPVASEAVEFIVVE
jgi:hypothetical protein